MDLPTTITISLLLFLRLFHFFRNFFMLKTLSLKFIIPKSVFRKMSTVQISGKKENFMDNK